jgi:type III secretory pathway component EscV
MTDDRTPILIEVRLSAALLHRCDIDGLVQTMAPMVSSAVDHLTGKVPIQITIGQLEHDDDVLVLVNGALVGLASHSLEFAYSRTTDRPAPLPSPSPALEWIEDGFLHTVLAEAVTDAVVTGSSALARGETLLAELGIVWGDLDPGEPADGESAVPTEPPRVVVHFPAEYLEELSSQEDLADLMNFMVDGLFVELGIAIPSIRCVIDDQLTGRQHVLQLRDTRLPAMRGLDPDTILVNNTVDLVRLQSVATTATINPANFGPAAIVAASHKKSLEAAGLTTWTQAGFLILTLAAALRANVHRLIDNQVVAKALAHLTQAFPEVVTAVHSTVEPSVLTGLLRSLARDQVCIRNLRAICQLACRYEDDGDQWDINRADYVRMGLNETVTHKLTRGTQTAVAYLLDPQLESLVASVASQTTFQPDWVKAQIRLVRAVRAEMRKLPATAQSPFILTGPGMRDTTQRMLRPCIPLVSVASYDDLADNINIQPVARISE